MGNYQDADAPDPDEEAALGERLIHEGMAERIEELQARVEALEASLRPFANVYHNWNELTDPHSADRVSGLSLSDIVCLVLDPYKAAAAALGEGGEPCT